MSATAQVLQDTETTRWPRSTKYYIQNVVIGVEGQLYSVPKQALTSQSPVFEGMFDVGDHSGGEGGSDVKPIVLEGYKKEDFECLLEILLPRPFEPFPPAMSKQEWTNTLKLATIWQMDKARALAIDQLSTLDLSPIEKIRYARDYHVSAWFKEGIVAIANDFDSYEMDQLGTDVGWKTTALILSLRDKAKPKELEQDKWWNHWRCPDCTQGSGVIVAFRGAPPATFLVKCRDCQTELLYSKDPLSTGPSPTSVERNVSQDAVSSVFAEEIKALDAFS
ncbi:hypothetical protein BKA70DRAFT_1188980 [Coprinopsis sp. MPI-PUGE-AT-0042]|nr:hypothetical protein BKA70DRAFT_1188980 [Coprinopsis sp. MPI-PUGE-AT-0042]